MKQIAGLPRRDFLAITGSLAGVIALAWIYLVAIATDMSMPGMSGMGAIPVWDASYFVMMFLMWAIMMVGMMLPSVIPTVLIYAAVARKSQKQGMPAAPTAAFVSGYLLLWVLFSLVATGAQWGLDELALLSPKMVSSSSQLTAALLIVAGIYQWLPIKNRCLTQCQSPVEFISRHWVTGTTGALRMGIAHGAFCLGCCWALMLLLFVGGVMNLIWIAVLGLFVLLEKVLPFGGVTGRSVGVLMILGGVVVAVIGLK